MTGWDLDEGERRDVLRRDILPLYFPSDSPSAEPTLVLLDGQPGAGRSRATGRLLQEHGGDLAAVSGDDLRAFHPHFRELVTTHSAEAPQVLGRATAEWVRECIRFARENTQSLLLEGTFHDPAVAAGTAARFAAEGFRTRVVVMASSRAESLLTVLSRYLRDVQAGNPARYTSRTAHERGFEGTRALVAALEASPSVDRLTLLGRDGHVVLDAENSGATAFRGAAAELNAAQSAPMGRFDATQWLSELHHLTKFAQSRRDLPREVTEMLVELHEICLGEVIPQLRVPEAGKFVPALEQRTAASLVALRRSLQPPLAVDAAAPVLTPSGPERGGPSR